MGYDAGTSAGAGNARTGAGYEPPQVNGDAAGRTDAGGSASQWADPSRYASADNGRAGADGWDGEFPEPTGGHYTYNSDGRVDGYVVDADGNGVPEAVWDLPDQHGNFKRAWYDTDGDGELDTLVVDSNRDGRVDEIVVDSNEDGVEDYAIADEDNDGNFDHEYLTRDGRSGFEIVNVDTDGDGNFDTTYHDHDGDGWADLPPHT